jgi:hypothetical protein
MAIRSAGFIKVVSKGNYVAVVCEREEQAIRAARQLKSTFAETVDASVPRIRRSFQLHAHCNARRRACFKAQTQWCGRIRTHSKPRAVRLRINGLLISA